MGQKTVTTGAVGGKGTWTVKLACVAALHAVALRSAPFVLHQLRDGAEMAFAGSDPYGIFSGALNSTTNAIQWGATGEAGSVDPTSG